MSAAALVLFVYHDVYWRPFDDTQQESVASYHAYGIAAANGVGLWPNPVVARHIDLGHSRIKPYPHWPNGFFLAFEGVLRIFGRTEMVGRTVAVVGTLLGFTLVVVSLGRKAPLVCAAVPLLLVSAAGRDSVPFVFADVALYAFIGVLLWTSGFERPAAFRVAMIAGLLSTHLVAPYAAGFAALRWFERRSRRDLAIDLVVLGAASLGLFVALAAGAGDWRTGFAELYRTLAGRSSYPLQSWGRILTQDVRDSLNLGWLSIAFVAAAWVVVVVARWWRVALLLPSFLLFALLLRGYVAQHHFTRLPFLFFCLVTILAAVEVVLRPAALRVLAAAALAVPLVGGTRHYRTDPLVRATRDSLYRITTDPATAATLARCNAFQFHLNSHFYNPDDRIGQFFFGRQVVERVRHGDPVRTCHVDLIGQTVHGPL